MRRLQGLVVRWATRVQLAVLVVEFSSLVIGFLWSGRLIWRSIHNFRERDVGLRNWHPAGELHVRCRILRSDTVGKLRWHLLRWHWHGALSGMLRQHRELSGTLRQHSRELRLAWKLWHRSHHRTELIHEFGVLHHQLWETFHHVWWEDGALAILGLRVEKLLGWAFHVESFAVFAFPVLIEMSFDGKIFVLSAGWNLRCHGAGHYEACSSCRFAITALDVPWIIARLEFFVEVETEWALVLVGFVI